MSSRFRRRLGFLLLALWLILEGLLGLVNFTFQGLGVIMAIVALAAGILILLER